MNLTSRVLLPLTAGATLLGLAVAPAAAERASYPDPADVGGASLNDVRRVTVDHTDDALSVRVKVTDLRRHSEQGPAGLTIRIDTRRSTAGPEFRLTTGLYEGTDYQLVRMRDGRAVGGPLGCDHRVHLGFATDVVRFSAARTCLGSPASARVGVKMTDLYDGSHPVTDWLGEPGSWTARLAAG
ncbi:hypothetical protein [Nocardioides sp.]|uniref:hypothetical protein n=1 Tax=Nocardioides sp. TaxID=35761 RepID=UPI0037847043